MRNDEDLRQFLTAFDKMEIDPMNEPAFTILQALIFITVLILVLSQAQ